MPGRGRKGREESGEGTTEEVNKAPFPEAKEDTGHPEKDPLRPQTRVGNQKEEIQVVNAHRK